MTMESSNAQRSGSSWRRRKEARPAEITAAALEVFADHGFAATRLDDIASRAGVVKGSIYRYFSTKEDLFRAVVRAAVVPSVEAIRGGAGGLDGRFAELAPQLLLGAAAVLSRPLVSRYARMVIGESRNFPDLARIWHDEVVSPVIGGLAGVIARAQARGEVRDGDPRIHAFSLVGPLFMGMLFRDVFEQASPEPPDLVRLAEQHGLTVLRGLLTAPPSSPKKE
jgi:AcrR family transcriptional regulator